MRKILIVTAVAATLMVACEQKKQVFEAADGSVTATVSEGRNDWKITDSTGRELVTDYDSMRVVEVSDDGHPMTFYYCCGNKQLWFQYYSTMVRRSEGTIVDGLREGIWVFYHPNGMKQCEANYVQGREEGTYTVFRDNGHPYYRGQYLHGQRTGAWEVYDDNGELLERKEY